MYSNKGLRIELIQKILRRDKLKFFLKQSEFYQKLENNDLEA